MIHTLQTACDNGELRALQGLLQGDPHPLPPIQLRDLLDYRSDAPRIGLDEVESVNAIRKRFLTLPV